MFDGWIEENKESGDEVMKSEIISCTKWTKINF